MQPEVMELIVKGVRILCHLRSAPCAVHLLVIKPVLWHREVWHARACPPPPLLRHQPASDVKLELVTIIWTRVERHSRMECSIL
jgi:hypothetical protein